MGKYLCMYSTEIRNMTCNSLKLLTRPHTCIRVICYDAKQQICCRQTIYNFSSHLFQKYCGTELHNPAMQMFLGRILKLSPNSENVSLPLHKYYNILYMTCSDMLLFKLRSYLCRVCG